MLSMVILAGCSSKQTICPKPYDHFIIYDKPSQIKLHILHKGDPKKIITSQGLAIRTLATKTRKQDIIIKAYENDILSYRTYIKKVNK